VWCHTVVALQPDGCLTVIGRPLVPVSVLVSSLVQPCLLTFETGREQAFYNPRHLILLLTFSFLFSLSLQRESTDNLTPLGPKLGTP
jgi:hypothetical protein